MLALTGGVVQYGNKVCPGETCCSQYGWCGGKQGTTSAWCSDGQQGIQGGKFDGKPILQTSVSNNKIIHQLILVEKQVLIIPVIILMFLKQDSRLNQHVNLMDLTA